MLKLEAMLDYEMDFDMDAGDIKDSIRSTKTYLDKIKHYQQLHNADASRVRIEDLFDCEIFCNRGPMSWGHLSLQQISPLLWTHKFLIEN